MKKTGELVIATERIWRVLALLADMGLWHCDRIEPRKGGVCILHLSRETEAE